MAEPEPKLDAMGTSSPSQTFVGGVETIRDARDFVREQLVDTHVDVERAVLLTSELATNAVVHARSEYMVTIRRSTGSIRVELLNDAPRLWTIFSQRPPGPLLKIVEKRVDHRNDQQSE